MRIGFLVDGQAEYRSLPALLLRIATRHTLLPPLYADIQPFAPVGQVAGIVRAKLPVLRAKGADCAVVLIDRETKEECPGLLAAAILAEIGPACTRWGITSAAVVLKDRTFENWLVSDANALRAIPGRFTVSDAQVRAIGRGADRLDAQRLLKRAARGDSYDKVADAVRILRLAEPWRMAQASRSFRKLLRVVGDADYADQSLRPCRVA